MSGPPSIWSCLAVAIALGAVCFLCIKEGMLLMSIKKTDQTPGWIKAVGVALVVLGLSSVLVAFRHVQ